MTQSKIYLHEDVNIVGMHRPDYFEHITAGWGHIAREERNLLCVGVWGVVGSTGPWIKVINVWELDGWHGLAANLDHETKSGTMMDPSLTDWWSVAASYRSSGFDRLLMPSAGTPPLAELLTAPGTSSRVYYQQYLRVRPRTAPQYLDLLESDGIEAAGQCGLTLVGAYRTAMRRDDEVVVIWAVESWEAWAELEANRDHGPMREWDLESDRLVDDVDAVLMCPAPLAPVYTGKAL